MPSKAETYRMKYAEFYKTVPEPFHIEKEDGGIWLRVLTSGDLDIYSGAYTISPEEALALRDWLTDTFDDGGER